MLRHMSELHVVILAAGKGTRMKSALPKVLHPLAGRPLIEHVLRTARSLDAATTTLVVGHGADERAHGAGGLAGAAVRRAVAAARHRSCAAAGRSRCWRADAARCCCSTPTCRCSSRPRSIACSSVTARARAAATVLTAEVADPYGYGRIVRDDAGQIARIVEERDASADERRSKEINSGIYAFDLEPLFAALHALATDNAQGEYYLTDLVAMYRQRGLARRDSVSRRRRRAARRQQPRRSRRARCRGPGAQEPRADARRRHARGSVATTYVDDDVDDRQRHDARSRRRADGRDDDRRALPDSRVAHG